MMEVSTGLEHVGSHVGIVLNYLKIAVECWRIRRSSPSSSS